MVNRRCVRVSQKRRLWRQKKRQKNVRQGFFRPTLINALLVLGVSSWAFYLFCVNSGATQGYEIRELEQQVVQLEKQHDRLQLEVAQKQSLLSIEESLDGLGMVQMKRAVYVSRTDSSLALR